jgi:SIR2-like domain
VSGQVHVVHGDLTVLDCDVAVVPTDALLRVEQSWHDLITQDEARAAAPRDWHGGPGARCFRAGRSKDGGPLRLLLEVAAEGSRPVQWYLDGVHEALDEAVALDVGHPPRRRRPLLALPLVGTGLGGSAGQRGELIPPLLNLLYRHVSRHELDVALVAFNRSDYAAVQACRGETGALPASLEEHAQRLAQLAADDELVPFVGAGVSAAAGLPAWWELLEHVADVGELLDTADTAALHGLGPLDAAELLKVALGDEAIEAVTRALDAPRHSLAHGLLASLLPSRTVTTNYDRLVELAYRRPAADRGGLAVLPWDALDTQRPWLVKMHGDVGHPDSIVLSRGDLLGYDLTRKPLASLLQGQMLTGHLLFAGSSMTDDAVVRLAWEVRELQRAWGAPPRVVGTVLGVREEPLRARLWQDVLAFVPLLPLADGDSGEDSGADPGGVLPAFLDRLAQLASRERSYLLDPRYARLVTEPLRPVRDALLQLGEALAQLPDDVDPATVDHVARALRTFGWRSHRPETGEAEGRDVGVGGAALGEVGEHEAHEGAELEPLPRVAARDDDPAGQRVENEAPVR